MRSKFALRGVLTTEGVFLPHGSIIRADTKKMTVTDEHNVTHNLSKENMGVYLNAQCFENPMPDTLKKFIESLEEVHDKE